MLRIAILLYLTVFLSPTLYAEEDIHVIEIRYEVYVENVDSLSSYKYNLPYEAIHVVSPDKIITLNKYAADVDEFHLYDLKESLDYRFYLKDDGQNVAVKSPLQQIPTLVTGNNDERRYQIAGMLCKRYEMQYKDTTIEIYTTDSFGVNFTPFSQVSGYAMQYTFVDEVYGKVTYKAKSIYPTLVSNQAFSLESFEITDELFPADVRSSFDEAIVSKESVSLFKLNKKKISYNFKLVNREKIDEKMDQEKMVVFAVGGVHKYNAVERDLLAGLIAFGKNNNVQFYYFTQRYIHTKKEISQLEDIGFKVAFLKDVILSRFKIEYFPTYILLDKDRKVVKYKINTNSEMLSDFSKKIIQLNQD